MMLVTNNTENKQEIPCCLIVRYVDDYGWDWRTVVKVINRSYHSEYKITDLKALYRHCKANGDDTQQEGDTSGKEVPQSLL